MRYEIVLAREAADDLHRLPANLRAEVKAALEKHLRYRPTSISKSRIKRLRGLSRPQYRLRVADIRVFYDVSEGLVKVLAIVPKSGVDEWLERVGE